VRKLSFKSNDFWATPLSNSVKAMPLLAISPTLQSRKGILVVLDRMVFAFTFSAHERANDYRNPMTLCLEY